MFGSFIRAVGALCLLGASCSQPAQMDAGVDAGEPDAGRLDAGFDAGRDTGFDAGTDAGQADAGPPGAWTQVPGLPEVCDIEYTTDASELGGVLRTAPCPASVEGACRQLVPEWEGVSWFDLRAEGGGTHDGRTVYHFLRNVEGSWQRWVVRDDGTPLLGIRSVIGIGACYHVGFDIEGEYFAFTASEPESSDHLHGWVLGGRLIDGEATVENFGRLTDELPAAITSPFFRIRVSDRLIAAETSPYHAIVTTTWTGERAVIADPSDGGQTYVSAAIGDAVLYDVFGSHRHARLSVAGGRGAVYIAPDDSQANAAATDGTDLAWIQSYFPSGPTLDRLELWTSPYAERREDLTPRRGAVVSGTATSPPAIIGGGYFAVLEPAPEDERTAVACLYRLSDGARVMFRAPEGYRIRTPGAFITEDTFALPLGIIAPGDPPQDAGLMLFDISSLDFETP